MTNKSGDKSEHELWVSKDIASVYIYESGNCVNVVKKEHFCSQEIHIQTEGVKGHGVHKHSQISEGTRKKSQICGCEHMGSNMHVWYMCSERNQAYTK